jgi:hypothetical protein
LYISCSTAFFRCHQYFFTLFENDAKLISSSPQHYLDKRKFTKEEILAAGVKDIRTGRPLTEADLTKEEYTGKDFDDELFIELRTPAMCEDLFALLCRNGAIALSKIDTLLLT